jgi:hypothetical protein
MKRVHSVIGYWSYEEILGVGLLRFSHFVGNPSRSFCHELLEPFAVHINAKRSLEAFEISDAVTSNRQSRLLSFQNRA